MRSDVTVSNGVAGREPGARHQPVPIKARDMEHIAPGRDSLRDLS